MAIAARWPKAVARLRELSPTPCRAKDIEERAQSWPERIAAVANEQRRHRCRVIASANAVAGQVGR